MSQYQALISRLREDAEFRAALEAASTPEARADVVRQAGLELPEIDDVLQGVAGGAPLGGTSCIPGIGL